MKSHALPAALVCLAAITLPLSAHATADSGTSHTDASADAPDGTGRIGYDPEFSQGYGGCSVSPYADLHGMPSAVLLALASAVRISRRRRS